MAKAVQLKNRERGVKNPRRVRRTYRTVNSNVALAMARRAEGMDARLIPPGSTLSRIYCLNGHREYILDHDTSFHSGGTQVSPGSGPARWTPVNPVRSGRKQRQQDKARCGSVRPGWRTYWIRLRAPALAF